MNTPWILLAVFLLVGILILSLYARHFATKDVRLFSELASKRQGKVVMDSFTSWATTTFPYYDTEITVYQRKGLGGKRVRTCLKCYLNLSDYLSIHVAKGVTGQTSVKELGQWFLVPQVQIGSDAFNKEFVIHGNDRNFLQRVFSADFQKRFLSLNTKDPTLYLHAQKQSFRSTKDGKLCKHLLEFSVNDVPMRLQELDKLIDEGLAVIGAVIKAGGSSPVP